MNPPISCWRFPPGFCLWTQTDLQKAKRRAKAPEPKVRYKKISGITTSWSGNIRKAIKFLSNCSIAEKRSPKPPLLRL
jgi:hypothetical protein